MNEYYVNIEGVDPELHGELQECFHNDECNQFSINMINLHRHGLV